MADGIGGILTQKVGPIPLWGWLAGGGLAVWLVASGKLGGILGQSSTSSTQASAAGQTAATSAGTQNAGSQLSQEIGLLQQLQAFQQQSYSNNLQQVQQTQQTTNALNPPPATQQSLTLTASHVNRPGETGIPANSIPIYSLNQNSQGIIGYAPAGSQLPFVSQTTGFGGDLGYTVQYGGVQGFVAAQDVAGVGQGTGGVGGPRRIPSAGVGRNAVGVVPAMWRGGHALVRAGGAGPLYPHYAMGGPRHVTQIGALAHVHPARVLAANAHLKRGAAAPNQIVRVA